MEELLFSLNSIIPIFLMMVLGYVLRQIGMVDDSFVQKLNKINFTITLPFLVFKDLAASDFYSVWDTRYVLYCFLVTLSSILVIWFLASLFYRDKNCVGEFVQASYRSSAAVLGIAFIQNIYGTSGMAPLMIVGTVPLYNIAAVFVLSFTGKNNNGPDKTSLRKSVKGILTNPILIGIALGVLASVCRLDFPPIIDKTINNVAVLASPLALLGLGAGFEGRKALKQIIPTAVASSLKLIILPALFLPLAVFLGFTQEKLVAILVMLGSPTTASCYIMAKNMGHDGTLTSSTVVATTFLSSITLTGWLFLLKSLHLI